MTKKASTADRILAALADCPSTPSEIAAVLKIAKLSVSRTLKDLKRYGKVRSTAKTRGTPHQVGRPESVWELTESTRVIEAAFRVRASSGSGQIAARRVIRGFIFPADGIE